MSADSDRVLVSTIDHVAHVRMNRADKRNGLDLAQVLEHRGLELGLVALEGVELGFDPVGDVFDVVGLVGLEEEQRGRAPGVDIVIDDPKVSRVLFPALETDPGHALWKRDFDGAASLFGVVLKPATEASVIALIDSLELFGIGSSWGLSLIHI